MEVRVKNDSVEIEGYVNAIERNSKPLMSQMGQFIERICKGAFKRALQKNDDVHILLNHDWNRDLGSTKEGNLELEEDNIGLKARATITDPEVVKKAKQGDLVGWSFGFTDGNVENTIEHGMPTREVKDLNLYEVSILDRTKTPAYDGTLIMARDNSIQLNIRDNPMEEVQEEQIEHQEDEQKMELLAEKIASMVVEKLNGNKEPVNEEQPIEEPVQETRAEEVVEETTTEEVPKQQEIVEKNIDYSQYDALIKEMKEE